ncbi:hypothetical protein O3P69_013993 [Scylla paramamosain]|uniref:Uncharacterized protein n=1 Tax=Scylla paramamosain TaxID=85552 RepID=A0AAW0SRX9_SCYPA
MLTGQSAAAEHELRSARPREPCSAALTGHYRHSAIPTRSPPRPCHTTEVTFEPLDKSPYHHPVFPLSQHQTVLWSKITVTSCSRRVCSECASVWPASEWHQGGEALAMGSCSWSVRQKSAVETRRCLRDVHPFAPSTVFRGRLELTGRRGGPRLRTKLRQFRQRYTLKRNSGARLNHRGHGLPGRGGADGAPVPPARPMGWAGRIEYENPPQV